MVKIHSFGMEIRPFKTASELSQLDAMVNNFIVDKNVSRVISVSDTTTTDDRGETIGLIRVLCYEA
jgi:hypothetical protein